MKVLITSLLLLSFSTFAKVEQSKQLTKITLNSSNVVVMNQPFDYMSVSKVQQELLEKINVTNPPQEVYLFLDTPGGSVSAGKLLIDTVNALPIKVNTITSFAASMGYNTVQGLRGKRYITPSGTLMSHRAAVGGISGQVPGEANSRLKMIQESVESLDKIASQRVGISEKQYQELILNEYWVHGDAAVKANHADEVIDVTCDKDLLTTKDDTLSIMGFTIKVKLSNCPLIQGPLSFEVENKDYITAETYESVVKEYKKRVNLKNTVLVTP